VAIEHFNDLASVTSQETEAQAVGDLPHRFFGLGQVGPRE
jgi:hypothetical protein